MSHMTQPFAPRRRLFAMVLVLPMALAACAQQQQVEPDDLVKPDPTYSKLGAEPLPAE